MGRCESGERTVRRVFDVLDSPKIRAFDVQADPITAAFPLDELIQRAIVKGSNRPNLPRAINTGLR